MSLREKVALITGAASGIGRGAAIALGSTGATIAGADLDIDAMRVVADLLRKEHIATDSFQSMYRSLPW